MENNSFEAMGHLLQVTPLQVGLTMDELELAFDYAKKNEKQFIMVLVEMGDGYPRPERIINPACNFDGKIAYYKETYDENCVHKYSKHIRITQVSCFDGLFADGSVVTLEEMKDAEANSN